MPISDQGHRDHRYLLIPRTLIFLTQEAQILLIKGASHKRLWANLYNGIGGHVEPGEDLLSAARRELAEETGLKFVDLWLCGTITIDTRENPGIGIFVYRGECHDRTLKESPEGTLEWVSIDQVFTLPLVEDLHILLPKVLETGKGSDPFSGLYKYDANDQLKISFEG